MKLSKQDNYSISGHFPNEEGGFPGGFGLEGGDPAIITHHMCSVSHLPLKSYLK